jgi:hypothetical protein
MTTPDVLSEPPDEPVIHWMERPPAMVAPLVIGGAILGAFVLGALAVIGASVVLGHFNEDEG